MLIVPKIFRVQMDLGRRYTVPSLIKPMIRVSGLSPAHQESTEIFLLIQTVCIELLLCTLAFHFFVVQVITFITTMNICSVQCSHVTIFILLQLTCDTPSQHNEQTCCSNRQECVTKTLSNALFRMRSKVLTGNSF